MDAAQVLVTVIGLGLVAFVAWFFFGAPHRVAAAAPAADGVQPVAVRAQGGYPPGVVEVRRGQPGPSASTAAKPPAAPKSC